MTPGELVAYLVQLFTVGVAVGVFTQLVKSGTR